MSNNLYEVQKLHCKYESTNYIALEVDELSIQEGSIVFIVGPSGVGKSTILETLGVMNNTIVPSNDTKLKFHTKGTSEDFLKLWHRKEKMIADFRKQYMSFIFQNTNLFTSLSVYENIMLPALFQGTNYNDTVQKAKEILNSIAKDLKKDKKIAEISEGERQRVAFARAMTTQFSVLFADEPTGNLDAANAENLMTHLQAHLKEHNQTAVIVTHEMEQALKYADKIVFISKRKFENSDKTYGYIGNDMTYHRNEKSLQNGSSDGKEWSEEDLLTYLKQELITN